MTENAFSLYHVFGISTLFPPFYQDKTERGFVRRWVIADVDFYPLSITSANMSTDLLFYKIGSTGKRKVTQKSAHTCYVIYKQTIL